MRLFLKMSTKKEVVKEVKPAVPQGEEGFEALPIAELRGKKTTGFNVKKGAIVALVVGLMCLPMFGKAMGLHLAMITLLGNGDLRSGRVGAWVYMADGRIRAYVKPRKVLNSFTAAAKALFALFSSIFGKLTAKQIDGWNAYVVTVSNRLGQPTVVRGKQAYLRLNCNIANVGGSPISDAPVGEVNPAATLDPRINAATATTLSVVYDTNTDGATTEVWATAPRTLATRRPGATSFVLVSVIDTSISAGAGVSIYAAYIARWGAPIVGSQTFIKMKTIDASTGLESAFTQSPGFTTT